MIKSYGVDNLEDYPSDFDVCNIVTDDGTKLVGLHIKDVGALVLTPEGAISISDDLRAAAALCPKNTDTEGN
jgi:hypothetical protein